MQRQYEYEERAFLEEENFLSTLDYLNSHALSKQHDNKQSYFFVLPDINVSIAASHDNVKAKYKGGQLGLGNGFEEKEFNIQPDSLDDAIEFFSVLLSITPQTSYQFRINFALENNIEAALKYTEMWGFHLEVERTYMADETSKSKEEADSIVLLDDFAHTLGMSYITDQEMRLFKKQCAENKLRGAYTAEQFKDKYGKLFDL